MHECATGLEDVDGDLFISWQHKHSQSILREELGQGHS